MHPKDWAPSIREPHESSIPTENRKDEKPLWKLKFALGRLVRSLRSDHMSDTPSVYTSQQSVINSVPLQIPEQR